MASIIPDLGFGATITFSSSFFTARALNIQWTGMEREWVETTTLATTGGKTFVPSDVYDPGSLEVEMQFRSGTTPPIVGASETVTITFPDLETWAASGYMSGIEWTAPLTGDVMTARATLKFTGAITLGVP
jgi:hypothetical protein